MSWWRPQQAYLDAISPIISSGKEELLGLARYVVFSVYFELGFLPGGLTLDLSTGRLKGIIFPTRLVLLNATSLYARAPCLYKSNLWCLRPCFYSSGYNPELLIINKGLSSFITTKVRYSACTTADTVPFPLSILSSILSLNHSFHVVGGLWDQSNHEDTLMPLCGC